MPSCDTIIVYLKACQTPRPHLIPVTKFSLTVNRWSIFGPYMALLVIGTAISYLTLSLYAAERTVKPQRKSIALARNESQVMYDTVGGWSSVSYFSRHSYEKRRYSAAVGS